MKQLTMVAAATLMLAACDATNELTTEPSQPQFVFISAAVKSSTGADGVEFPVNGVNNFASYGVARRSDRVTGTITAHAFVQLNGGVITSQPVKFQADALCVDAAGGNGTPTNAQVVSVVRKADLAALVDHVLVNYSADNDDLSGVSVDDQHTIFVSAGPINQVDLEAECTFVPGQVSGYPITRGNVENRVFD